MSASPARIAAREVLTRVREGSAYAHEVLGQSLRRMKLTGEDAAFATRLAYGALQTEGTLDEAIDRHLGGKRIEPRVRDALRVSAYELLYLSTEQRAAVHQGVELVRSARKQAAGLANAVLRRIAEDASTFPWGDPDTDTHALARLHGHPAWLAEMWIAELGRDTATAVMAADNEPAPLFLAENPFAGTSEVIAAALADDGAEASPCEIAGCLVAGDPGAAVRGSALADGLVIATDAAAQFVAGLVRAHAGMTIVEVGAGRGTKTLLMQAAAKRSGGVATIHAVDVHEFKSKLLTQRLDRFGVPGVHSLTGDATSFESIQGAPSQGSVDAVLVDAPCSGLGTLRRHPEKRWRVTPADLESLAELGARLLEAAALLVRPGGFVVYSTCTLAEVENDRVIQGFLGSEQGSSFRIDSFVDEVPLAWRRFVTPEGYFRSVPELGGPDGHFAVRLVRVESSHAE